MVTTNDGRGAERMRRLRNHGVTRDASLMLTRRFRLRSRGAQTLGVTSRSSWASTIA
jgi:dTDP-4-amino-4,6-dideoxygalactose transaminase